MNYITNINNIRYINMSEAAEDRTYCCNFCKCVEDNKHIFENKVLMNRIHKCRIVDISTETQYTEMHERMRNKQIETSSKCKEK